MQRKIMIFMIMSVLLLISFSAGSAQPDIRSNADQMTENILQAMNADNYADYSRDFSAEMKKDLSEADFKEMNADIKAKIGNYISKEYQSMQTKDQYTIVTYKAKFSQEPGAVVKSVFCVVNGKICVAGFLLESPKLQEKEK